MGGCEGPEQGAQPRTSALPRGFWLQGPPLPSSEVQRGCDLLVENTGTSVTSALAGSSWHWGASPSSPPAVATAQAAFVGSRTARWLLLLPQAQRNATLSISVEGKVALAVFIAKPVVAPLLSLFFVASTRRPSCGAGAKGVAGRAPAQGKDLRQSQGCCGDHGGTQSLPQVALWQGSFGEQDVGTLLRPVPRAGGRARMFWRKRSTSEAVTAGNTLGCHICCQRLCLCGRRGAAGPRAAGMW